MVAAAIWVRDRAAVVSTTLPERITVADYGHFTLSAQRVITRCRCLASKPICSSPAVGEPNLAEGCRAVVPLAYPTERGQCRTNCATDCPFEADCRRARNCGGSQVRSATEALRRTPQADAVEHSACAGLAFEFHCSSDLDVPTPSSARIYPPLSEPIVSPVGH
jgi:hypothetical protein